jgi:hypothetical protein
MNDLLSKISSYNIFNYLLPGIVFALFTEAITSFSFVQSDLVIGVFLYYFIGLVVSRFGSLVVEPALRRVAFLKFADYGDFVVASKNDAKLELLSEVNNTYRTLCSLFILLGVLKGVELVETHYPAIKNWNAGILLTSLFVMFLFSYRKQTQYVARRVQANGRQE